jgi:hypothetical protein
MMFPPHDDCQKGALEGGVSGDASAGGNTTAAAEARSPDGVNVGILQATAVIFGCVEMSNPGIDDFPQAHSTTAAFWAASSLFWQQLGSFFAEARCATTAPSLQPQLVVPGLSPQQQAARPETLQHLPPAAVLVVTGQPILLKTNANSVKNAVNRPRSVSNL